MSEEAKHTPTTVFRVTQAIEDYWGERCSSFDADCATCQAWREHDELSTLRTKKLESAEKALEDAHIAGWNACRKSLYAVCEDVQNEADRVRIVSTVGTAAEEQHAKGYHAGACYAAKSIARGFNSMEAEDDDNLRAALSSIRGEDAPPKFDTSISQETRDQLAEIDKAIRAGAMAGNTLVGAPKDDGWIEWKGGECPVGFDEYVEVKLRDGSIPKQAHHGRTWNWIHSHSRFDVVAYRRAR